MPITPAGEMVRAASLPPPTRELTRPKDFIVFALLEQGLNVSFSAGPEQQENGERGTEKDADVCF